ncbi:MAG: RNA-splicing ligase RtcB, partial [Actinobacteria bacterium]
SDLGLDLLYDVAHNGAKFEEHVVDGKARKLSVHRKGATRSFGPAMGQIPKAYKDIGQPVMIPGDMGRASFILRGCDKSEEQAFSSTAHGAGRLLSRKGAKKQITGAEVRTNLNKKGIVVVAGHMPSLAEEAPLAYKDVHKVVDICQGANLSLKVAELRPWGVLKG